MTTPERFQMPLGEAMFSMRAIRRFRPDPISDANLRSVLEAATQAPSGGNSQPWHFIAVRDATIRSKLATLYREAWWAKRRDAGINGPDDIPATDRVSQSAMKLADEIGDAPVMVMVCAVMGGPGAMTSVIPATQNLLLAARTLGIGGTITTLHSDVDERVRDLLAIPVEAQIVYCVPLGYPRGRFGPLNRRGVSEVVSADRWGEMPPWA